MKKIKSLFGWAATAVKTKDGPQVMYTNYGLTLDSMVDKEMALNPQTDKYRDVEKQGTGLRLELHGKALRQPM